MFFDGATDFKGVGIGAVLVSEIGQHYPVCAKLRFSGTNNMAEYEACILGLNLAVDMNIQELLVIGDSDLLVHQVQGEWATKNTKILPYLYHVQEMMRRFMKIEFRHVPRIQKEYLEKREYPEHENHTKKYTLLRLSNHFFQSGGILYRRTPDLGLIRYVDAKEASKLLEAIHSGTCGPHMNGFVLAKNRLFVDDYGNRLHQVCLEMSSAPNKRRYDTGATK
ncbi:uncharacterized protein [Nicotiana tomentosiformis]|uniref:uncharacterized protein n=1 Tax=Nicotiana tomentosiformis TaxID=4098 RepID=UPI00388C78F4